MGKFLVVVIFFSCLTASAAEFDFGVGGNINIKDATNSFQVLPSIGSKYIRFGLAYQIGSVLGITVQGFSPRLLLEYPVEFELSNNGLFSVGPMFDLGPSFSFGGGFKSISFMDIGFGTRLKYYFNEHIGVGLVPVHFTFNFANWTSGGVGTKTGLAIVYDVFASFLYKW